MEALLTLRKVCGGTGKRPAAPKNYTRPRKACSSSRIFRAGAAKARDLCRSELCHDFTPVEAERVRDRIDRESLTDHEPQMEKNEREFPRS